jgi:hypothetical protein
MYIVQAQKAWAKSMKPYPNPSPKKSGTTLLYIVPYFDEPFWSLRPRDVFVYRLEWLKKSGSRPFQTQGCQMVYFYTKTIPIWGYFSGTWNGKCWHILLPFVIFYVHLAYFMAIWYSLWQFGIYFGPRKIWQPCFNFNFAVGKVQNGWII